MPHTHFSFFFALRDVSSLMLAMIFCGQVPTASNHWCNKLPGNDHNSILLVYSISLYDSFVCMLTGTAGWAKFYHHRRITMAHLDYSVNMGPVGCREVVTKRFLLPQWYTLTQYLPIDSQIPLNGSLRCCKLTDKTYTTRSLRVDIGLCQTAHFR